MNGNGGNQKGTGNMGSGNKNGGKRGGYQKGNGNNGMGTQRGESDAKRRKVGDDGRTHPDRAVGEGTVRLRFLCTYTQAKMECPRTDCPFVHHKNICYIDLKQPGRCKAGADCKFLHDPL